jgi:predicted flap endonuclease-1-like 5' DNA nuclease
MGVNANILKTRRWRKGRGFSRNELRTAGLSVRHALERGLPVDPKRSTRHDANVATLTAWLRADTAPLTDVKGIGPKRAAQLKAIGVATVADLAGSDPARLGEQLSVSTQRAARWIANAQHLLSAS